MPVLLSTSHIGFESEFSSFLGRKRESEANLRDEVAEIIEIVRRRGDKALAEFTLKYDRFQLSSGSLPWSDDKIESEIGKVDPKEQDALERSAARIRDYHERQRPLDENWTDVAGARLGWRWT
ncbi:MAG: histidinol dehydrogenase, partial [Albidovulum sp.]|nr:histidinol dehydrogenase [Albidovulum sp.]